MARRLIGLDVGTNAVTVAGGRAGGTRRASTSSARSRSRATRCVKAKWSTTPR